MNFCRDSSEWNNVPPADVILFEGILPFYFREIRKLFDMKLFVDTDADTRLSRRCKRSFCRQLLTICQITLQLSRGGGAHARFERCQEACEKMFERCCATDYRLSLCTTVVVVNKKIVPVRLTERDVSWWRCFAVFVVQNTKLTPSVFPFASVAGRERKRKRSRSDPVSVHHVCQTSI